jgi:hypothetical protein
MISLHFGLRQKTKIPTFAKAKSGSSIFHQIRDLGKIGTKIKLQNESGLKLRVKVLAFLILLPLLLLNEPDF